MKTKTNEKAKRIIILVLGLVPFFFLFYYNYLGGFFDETFGLIDPDLSIIKEIGFQLYIILFDIKEGGEERNFVQMFWNLAIPIYWFLVWKFRFRIALIMTTFMKKI
ncbi:hypothetical protein OAM18_05665 [Candidatus Pelagibacter sp.]|jgi:hypothetical protein|nr:hypothetical protein [Candidatus Pelagibacter sp.]|tara:strand:+ start:54 stop:374 length:321 start_codon:yes stop_codon:yes gene_type:complete